MENHPSNRKINTNQRKCIIHDGGSAGLEALAFVMKMSLGLKVPVIRKKGFPAAPQKFKGRKSFFFLLPTGPVCAHNGRE
jgi:hypothetical protein